MPGKPPAKRVFGLLVKSPSLFLSLYLNLFLSQNMESAPDISGLGYSLLWQVFRRANAWDHMPVRDANRPGSLSLGS
jgi:hypothetical protein